MTYEKGLMRAQDIENWRSILRTCYDRHAETDALCDMALQAIRAEASKPEGVVVPDKMPDEFLAWIQREIPSGTVISNPAWWAPKIYRAMLRAAGGAEMSDTKPYKLSLGEKHLLRLIVQGRGSDGWAEVSKPVFPLIKGLPSNFVILETVGNEGRGRAKLTETGDQLISAMEWI